MENDKLKLYPHASRRALWRATDALGMTRGQGRLAYTNMKNALRRQGLRGSELRQTARWNIMDQAFAPKDDVFNIEESRASNGNLDGITIVPQDDAVQTIVGRESETSSKPSFWSSIRQPLQSFSKSFMNSKKQGLNEWEWDGARYRLKGYDYGNQPKVDPRSALEEMIADPTQFELEATPDRDPNLVKTFNEGFGGSGDWRNNAFRRMYARNELNKLNSVPAETPAPFSSKLGSIYSKVRNK